jgi:hypothetical protein
VHSALRSTVSWLVVLLIVVPAALGAAGCGGDEQATPQQADERAPATDTTQAEPSEESGSAGQDDAALAHRPAGEEGLRVPATRARIVAKESPFGHVLFDANGQVVYAFENDRRHR